MLFHYCSVRFCWICTLQFFRACDIFNPISQLKGFWFSIVFQLSGVVNTKCDFRNVVQRMCFWSWRTNSIVYHIQQYNLKTIQFRFFKRFLLCFYKLGFIYWTNGFERTTGNIYWIYVASWNEHLEFFYKTRKLKPMT